MMLENTVEQMLRMDKRLDSMGNRLNTMDQKFDTRFTALNDRL